MLRSSYCWISQNAAQESLHELLKSGGVKSSNFLSPNNLVITSISFLSIEKISKVTIWVFLFTNIAGDPCMPKGYSYGKEMLEVKGAGNFTECQTVSFELLKNGKGDYSVSVLDFIFQYSLFYQDTTVITKAMPIKL